MLTGWALLLTVSFADVVSWRTFNLQSPPSIQSRIARSEDGTRLIVSWGQADNESRTPAGRLLKVRPDDTVALDRSVPGVSYRDVAAGLNGSFYVLGSDSDGDFVFLMDRDNNAAWIRRIEHGDAVAIASDAAGNVLIAGRGRNGAQGRPVPRHVIPVSSGGLDPRESCLARYWGRRTGDPPRRAIS